jgi:GT2 family glycosyltransferase
VKFSVLICTFNRHELLEKALASIVDGTLEKPDEIVIVNAGDARADAVIKKFEGRNGILIKLLKVVNKNLAANRNLGLPHCSGDLIAMTDDDAEVFPDWVTRMKRAHAEHPEAGAVGGAVLGTNLESLVGKVADATTFPSWPDARHVRTLPGVNICYKKDAVERIGPQDETLFRGEDVDYNWRVISLGYKIYFDPSIKVYHYHRPTLKALLNQHYMYGRAYYLVRRKWPDMYCVYPHGLKKPKDWLKAMNFFASLLYQPLLSMNKIPKWNDRFAALPLLFLLGAAWKTGMAVEKIKTGNKH